MKKAFITAIGGDIGYGVVKALKESHPGLYIVGCDIRKNNYSYDLVDEFYISPAYKNTDEWIFFMETHIRKGDIDYFWPVTETEIKIVDGNRKIFRETKLVINNSDIIRIASNKLETVRFLGNSGVIVPETWETPKLCKRKFPLVVKGKFGCGSHNVRIVYNEDELVDGFDSIKDPIVQSYVGSDDEEYTMAIFSNGVVTNSISFRRELGFGGLSRFVELVNDDKLKDLAIQISDLFKLRGSINVQMRKFNGQYYVFEINPRISSTIGFRRKLRFNDAGWWIDMLDDVGVEKYVIPRKKAYGVRNVEEKIFFE